MLDRYDVVVVGGGAMGLATGWWAARVGQRVLVLEQFAVGHEHGSSHGSARIFRLAYADPRYVALARRAQQLWRELEADAGVSLLTVTGGIDHGDPAVVADVERHLHVAGLATERLTPRAAADRWPGMLFDEAVLFQPDAGVLHADRAVAVLHQQLLAYGAEYRGGVRVEEVRQVTDGVEVAWREGVVQARVAVVAAGAWAGPLLAQAGLAARIPPLRVTQEQPAFFATDGSGWPIFLHHREVEGGSAAALGFGHYGLLAAEGLKVGAHGAGQAVDPDLRLPIDPQRAARLEDYVQQWLPGASRRADSVDSCLYTSTPSEEFVLQREADIVVCSPCSGHGFKFVPAIGEVTSRLASA